MTTEELAELFLAHLYDLAEAAPHPNFLFTVNDFAVTVGVTDGKELQKALNLLGDRGFVIAASLDMFGSISAGITMDGSIFVEKGGETGIIARYRENPAAFMTGRLPAQAAEPQAPPAIAERQAEARQAQGVQPAFAASRAVEAIIADIEDILERDASVNDEVRQDALADLATLKIQLDRNVKNKEVIEAVLTDLRDIAPIAPFVTGLHAIVSVYFA
jgi:DNA-directed RNA polymerase subunit L